MPSERFAIASIVLLLAAPSAAQEGQPITEAMKPVLAATRIFALRNHLRGDIGVADEDEGHIGETFEVNHAPGQKCTFTMRHRDGPIVETLSFDRLSDEYKVVPDGIYTQFVIPGKSGAYCEIDNGSRRCTDGLNLLLMVEGSPSESDLAIRALRYMAGVCRPTELPF